jgi:hypothetical protein
MGAVAAGRDDWCEHDQHVGVLGVARVEQRAEPSRRGRDVDVAVDVVRAVPIMSVTTAGAYAFMLFASVPEPP